MSSHFLTLNDSNVKSFEKEAFDMNKKVEDLNSKIQKMTSSVNALEIEHGISYLDGKNLLLSLYMNNLLQFTSNKANGEHSEDLTKSLLYMKMVLEKSKVIDLKIASQLIKHQRIAEEGKISQEDNLKSRILNQGDDNEEEDQGEEENKQKKVKSQSKYKSAEESKYNAGRNYFDFTETKQEKKERRNEIDKSKHRIKNSELFNELEDEVTDRPEEFKGEQNTHLGNYMKEVQDYEEDMLTKVYVSKKKVKELKRKDRKEEDLNNFTTELKNLDKVLNNKDSGENDEYAKEVAMNKFKKQLKNEKKTLIENQEKNNERSKSRGKERGFNSGKEGKSNFTGKKRRS
mmetsp:Transcript_27724/g.28874  ORF Transcript_27724/g.28874 Transcript_27724/m.28874 type:complete len:345 (+) Transcript_27724:7-1041(+)